MPRGQKSKSGADLQCGLIRPNSRYSRISSILSPKRWVPRCADPHFLQTLKNDATTRVQYLTGMGRPLPWATTCPSIWDRCSILSLPPSNALSFTPETLPSLTIPSPGHAFAGPHLRHARVHPFTCAAENSSCLFVANRAHHSDIGGAQPASMGLSEDIYQEGLRIPPVLLVRNDRIQRDILAMLLANVRTPIEREGDLTAQIAACRLGERRD